ncbi:MAG: sulfite exporter TauE/SafE family protein [Solirubrobacterales bacterium]
MLELVAFGILCFVVAVAGGLAGLVLGNMRLPAAVNVADTVSAGGGANVAISAVAATTAAISHIRAGRVNWRLFGWLAPTSLIGGFAGGVVATELNPDILLAGISVVLLFTAIELFRWTPPNAAAPALASTSGEATDRHDRFAAAAIGLGVGLLGGAVGLILGALRLPALLRFTRETPQKLVGTNLSAGVLVGIAGAIGHLTAGSAGFDLEVFLVGAAASIPGASIGARLTGRLSTPALVRAIAVIVALAGIAMALQVIF